MTFRGLYAYSPERSTPPSHQQHPEGLVAGSSNGSSQRAPERIYGLGPAVLNSSAVLSFFKYDSAAKEFRVVHARSFSATTDAVSIEAARARRRSSVDGLLG